VVKLAGRKRTKIFFPTVAGALAAIGLAAHAGRAAMAEANSPITTGISSLDSQSSQAPEAITGDPAVESVFPGTGLAGRLLQLPEKTGLRLGGLVCSSRFDRSPITFHVGLLPLTAHISVLLRRRRLWFSCKARSWQTRLKG
jgi:hypothetical protein